MRSVLRDDSVVGHGEALRPDLIQGRQAEGTSKDLEPLRRSGKRHDLAQKFLDQRGRRASAQGHLRSSNPSLSWAWSRARAHFTRSTRGEQDHSCLEGNVQTSTITETNKILWRARLPSGKVRGALSNCFTKLLVSMSDVVFDGFKAIWRLATPGARKAGTGTVRCLGAVVGDRMQPRNLLRQPRLQFFISRLHQQHPFLSYKLAGAVAILVAGPPCSCSMWKIGWARCRGQRCWDKDQTPAATKARYLRVLKTNNFGMRNAWEMAIICQWPDHLALVRTRQAGNGSRDDELSICGVGFTRRVGARHSTWNWYNLSRQRRSSGATWVEEHGIPQVSFGSGKGKAKEKCQTKGEEQGWEKREGRRPLGREQAIAEAAATFEDLAFVQSWLSRSSSECKDGHEAVALLQRYLHSCRNIQETIWNCSMRPREAGPKSPNMAP